LKVTRNWPFFESVNGKSVKSPASAIRMSVAMPCLIAERSQSRTPGLSVSGK
jgi:hypothetical protein